MTRSERLACVRVSIADGSYPLDARAAEDAVVDGLHRDVLGATGELPPVVTGQGDYRVGYAPGVGSPFFRGFGFAVLIEACAAAGILLVARWLGWF